LIILGLDSTNRWKHAIFFSLAYLTQHYDSQIINFPANDIISFVFIAKWYFIVCGGGWCFYPFIGFWARQLISVLLLWIELQYTLVCKYLSCISIYILLDIMTKSVMQES
jgi:hypothetical protein